MVIKKAKIDLWRIGWLALIITPAILVFLFITSKVTNVPCWDEWVLTPLIAKAANANLNFSDLWALHNEHRVFFPQLFLVTLARIAGWNVFYEVFLSLLLAALNWWVIWQLLTLSLITNKKAQF